MMHAVHVPDGTWSSAEDLMHMGRNDLLPSRPSAVNSGQPDAEHGVEEPDETGLFQATRPAARTWEELMELFWEWFQQDRQVGMAVCMVRRFVQARGDDAYNTWSTSAVGALAAGIPQSDGVEMAITPEDFYVWATEVEEVRCLLPGW